ncbi:unnamed protein product, partial [Strongylus vulgaris]
EGSSPLASSCGVAVNSFLSVVVCSPPATITGGKATVGVDASGNDVEDVPEKPALVAVAAFSAETVVVSSKLASTLGGAFLSEGSSPLASSCGVAVSLLSVVVCSPPATITGGMATVEVELSGSGEDAVEMGSPAGSGDVVPKESTLGPVAKLSLSVVACAPPTTITGGKATVGVDVSDDDVEDVSEEPVLGALVPVTAGEDAVVEISPAGSEDVVPKKSTLGPVAKLALSVVACAPPTTITGGKATVGVDASGDDVEDVSEEPVLAALVPAAGVLSAGTVVVSSRLACILGEALFSKPSSPLASSCGVVVNSLLSVVVCSPPSTTGGKATVVLDPSGEALFSKLSSPLASSCGVVVNSLLSVVVCSLSGTTGGKATVVLDPSGDNVGDISEEPVLGPLVAVARAGVLSADTVVVSSKLASTLGRAFLSEGSSPLASTCGVVANSLFSVVVCSSPVSVTNPSTGGDVVVVGDVSEGETVGPVANLLLSVEVCMPPATITGGRTTVAVDASGNNVGDVSEKPALAAFVPVATGVLSTGRVVVSSKFDSTLGIAFSWEGASPLDSSVAVVDSSLLSVVVCSLPVSVTNPSTGEEVVAAEVSGRATVAVDASGNNVGDGSEKPALGALVPVAAGVLSAGRVVVSSKFDSTLGIAFSSGGASPLDSSVGVVDSSLLSVVVCSSPLSVTNPSTGEEEVDAEVSALSAESVVVSPKPDCTSGGAFLS